MREMVHLGLLEVPTWSFDVFICESKHGINNHFPDQEEIIGRQKVSGAPMDGHGEFDKPNFADDSKGEVTALDSHIRLSNPRTGENSERERILRRGYNFHG